MKKAKYNFKGRPDRACSTDELRPAMNYIFIDDGCMIATNGLILVRIPLDFSDLIGDIQLLNGYYIHRQQYVELLRYDSISITGEGEIRAGKNTGFDSFSATFKLKNESQLDRYPDYKKAIDYKSEAIDKIGVTKSVLKKFLSCFDGLDTNRFAMKLQSKGRAIHFHSDGNDEIFGIVMPAMLNDL